MRRPSFALFVVFLFAVACESGDDGPSGSDQGAAGQDAASGAVDII
jgi:hypothetical protein